MTVLRRARLAGARQPVAAHHAHQTAVGRVAHGQGHSVGAVARASAAVVLIQRRLEEARIPSLLYYFHSAVCASEVW